MTTPRWVVTSVKANDDYTLDLVFADGKAGRFDMTAHLNDRVYSPLKRIAFFRLARIECGTVVWNDDIDIAPELLWEGCVVSED